jgi:N-acetylmuramoyl-L-alanine amidase
MKFALSLGWILMIALAVQAHSAPAALERVSISGVEYIRLEDWARANRFQVKTTKQEVQVFNNDFNAAFVADSRRAALNGVNVWLSAPMAFRSGSACIPAVDLTTALQPVLSPPHNSPGKKIASVCLDPGHGGKDPGNQDRRQQEKTYTLLLAKELGALLSKAGFKVSFTRTRDDFVDLPDRPEKARAKAADLFISLHFNSWEGVASAVKGAEVYCLTPAHTSSTNSRGEGSNTGSYPGNLFDKQNLFLAYEVQKTLSNNLAVEDRGVKRARYAVLRSAAMPAILIEGGFMSNEAEAKKIYNTMYRRQMAQAITEAVLSFKKKVER